MLSILATILSWDDGEREKAGLQKVGKGKAPPMRRKGSTKDVERSAEEEAAMNEVSFSSATHDNTDDSPFRIYSSSFSSKSRLRDKLELHLRVQLLTCPRRASSHLLFRYSRQQVLGKSHQHRTTSARVVCRQHRMVHLVVRGNCLLPVEKQAMACQRPWSSDAYV
jgi:hypothetical protein